MRRAEPTKDNKAFKEAMKYLKKAKDQVEQVYKDLERDKEEVCDQCDLLWEYIDEIPTH